MSKLSKNLKPLLPVILASSLGLLPACSQMRELKEMHDATTEMRDTTKDMNQQTKSMGANTEEMKASTKDMQQLTKALSIKTEDLKLMTAELYRAAKQGTSLALREEIMKRIMDSRTQVEKLSKTAKYFMAFEYQIWSGIGPDTAESREKLAASAAREFMREVQRFTPADLTDISPALITELALDAKAALPQNPPAPALKAVAQMEAVSTFNALAVTLHILNPIQEDLVEGKKVEKLSMYTMIKEAITADKLIESGGKSPSAFPEFVGEIRSYLDVAKALVGARAESLALMALARFSPLAVAKDKSAAIGELGTKWNYPEKINSKVIRDASLFLKGAIESREFMKEASVPLEFKGFRVKLFLANGTPSEEMKGAIEAAKAGTALTERQAALAEFAALVEKFLSYE